MKRFKVVLAVLISAFCSISYADGFRLQIDQTIVPVGGMFTIDIIIEPSVENPITGGHVILEVDPQAVGLAEKRTLYSSNGAFSLVEKFEVKPASGTVMLRANAPEPIKEAKIFLRIKAKMQTAGSTMVRLTTTPLTADKKRLPSASEHFTVFGIEGEEIDPVLRNTVMMENRLLSEGIVPKIEAGEKETASGIGFAELQEATEREKADVIVGFSKTKITIGQGQWVRLDVEVKKIPPYETIMGASLVVNYDPQYLDPVSSAGAIADKVELNEVFSSGWDNVIDRQKGEIRVEITTPPEAEMKEMELPIKLVTLYFKAQKAVSSTEVRVTKADVTIMAIDSTMLKEPAVITIAGKSVACDPDLPATLCSGTFEILGSVAFRFASSYVTRGVLPQTTSSRALSESERFLSATTQQQVTTYTLKRMFLEQTWNLELLGSLRNGWSVKGYMRDAPYSQQQLKINITGGKGEMQFGDLTAGLTGAKLIGVPQKSARGFQFNYKSGPWSLNALSVELRSSPVQMTIKGNGTYGPYVISGAQGAIIIPSSVRIDKNQKPMRSDEYEIDYGRGEIKFTKAPILTSDTIIMYYEQSSLIFSTGKLMGTRLQYAPEGKHSKIGLTYFTTTSAQEGVSVILGDSESYDLAQFATSTCPEVETGACVELPLRHQYIIKDSILITSDSGLANPLTDRVDKGIRFSATAPFYIDHRAYFQGKIYLNYDEMTKNDNYTKFTISYKYYNPSYIITNNIITYQMSGKTNTIDQPWPTQLFPGSESVFSSLDDQRQINLNDNIMCFKDGTVYPSGDSACRTTININTYKLSENGTNFYLDFEYTEPNFIKMTYHSIMPVLPKSSEFQKTAAGIDAEYNLGKHWKLNAEYGQTNSDLSSSFNTAVENITVDVTTNSAEPITGTACSYQTFDIIEEIKDKDTIGPFTVAATGTTIIDWTLIVKKNDIQLVENTDYTFDSDKNEITFTTPLLLSDIVTVSYNTFQTNALRCKLAHENVFGQVQVQVQRCRRQTNAGSNILLGECTGVYPQSPETVLLSDFSVKVTGGYLEMVGSNIRINTDGTYKEYSDEFPDEGDTLIVTYTYEPILPRLVDGSALDFSAVFTSRKLDFSLHKHERDPYFDKGVMGQQTEDTSQFETSTTLRLKRLNIALSTTRPRKEEMDQAGKIFSSLKRPSDNLTLNYSRGRLTKFSLIRTTLGNKGVSEAGQPSDTKNTTKSFGLDYMLMKNNVMTTGFSRNITTSQNAYSPQSNTRNTVNTYSWNYSPSQKYSLRTTYGTTDTQPARSKSSNRNYNITFEPFTLFKLKVDFGRTKASQPTGSGVSSSITDNINYTLNVKPMWKISNIAYTLNRSGSPASSTRTATRTDNQNINFTTKLGREIEFIPAIKRLTSISGTSHTLNETKDWKLKYIHKKDAKSLSIELSLINADNITTNMSEPGKATVTYQPTKNESAGINYIPTSKYSINTTLTRSIAAGNLTRNWSNTINFNPQEKLSLTGTYSRNRQSGTAMSINSKYSLTANYKITQDTVLKMEYSNDITSQVKQGSSNRRSTFSAGLQANFRGGGQR
ncbi:MAG: hypothetical protein AB1546_02735 [bacterium]